MDKQLRLIAISRALFAISTLLILTLNSDATLFGVNSFSNDWLKGLSSINFFYLFGQESILISKALASIILMASITGHFPRFTIIPQLWIQWSFINSSITIEGGDQISYLVTLFLTPIFLLDNRRNMWQELEIRMSKTHLEVTRFCLNLIKIQAVIIYFVASVGKYPVEQWLNGSSLYYWFIDPTFGMPDYLKALVLPLMKSDWIIFIGAWIVLLLELFLATGLFMKNEYKNKLFIGGVLFHLSIYIVHGLPNFMISMVGLLIIYLQVDFKKMEVIL